LPGEGCSTGISRNESEPGWVVYADPTFKSGLGFRAIPGTIGIESGSGQKGALFYAKSYLYVVSASAEIGPQLNHIRIDQVDYDSNLYYDFNRHTFWLPEHYRKLTGNEIGVKMIRSAFEIGDNSTPQPIRSLSS
jgi:hypothetical protein